MNYMSTATNCTCNEYQLLFSSRHVCRCNSLPAPKMNWSRLSYADSMTRTSFFGTATHTGIQLNIMKPYDTSNNTTITQALLIMDCMKAHLVTK